MSATIYLLTNEDDSAYYSVFSRDGFLANEIEYNPKSFLNIDELGPEIDKVKLEIVKISSDIERVSLEYSELVEEMEVIKNNLDWLSKTTTFGNYTREMLQELPQKINIESLLDYRSQVNIRVYEITKAERAANLTTAGSSNSNKEVDLEKLQQLISLYKALLQQIDTFISVSGDYSSALEEARAFLQERQVWTYSNSPIWNNIFDLDTKKLFGVVSPMDSISKNRECPEFCVTV
ncbi:hypothetical protein [Vibrio parahaemolyticus]|uniref:hypothetical protein n=1 Tax=Vibrio parahaemolyticus TaxID=670 RepID=UPI001640150B|nr:hypothetical protein [Vibrio parahaemolyticus]